VGDACAGDDSHSSSAATSMHAAPGAR
jgi:hypothetical protein